MEESPNAGDLPTASTESPFDSGNPLNNGNGNDENALSLEHGSPVEEQQDEVEANGSVEGSSGSTSVEIIQLGVHTATTLVTCNNDTNANAHEDEKHLSLEEGCVEKDPEIVLTIKPDAADLFPIPPIFPLLPLPPRGPLRRSSSMSSISTMASSIVPPPLLPLTRSENYSNSQPGAYQVSGSGSQVLTQPGQQQQDQSSSQQVQSQQNHLESATQPQSTRQTQSSLSEQASHSQQSDPVRSNDGVVLVNAHLVPSSRDSHLHGSHHDSNHRLSHRSSTNIDSVLIDEITPELIRAEPYSSQLRDSTTTAQLPTKDVEDLKFKDLLKNKTVRRILFVVVLSTLLIVVTSSILPFQVVHISKASSSDDPNSLSYDSSNSDSIDDPPPPPPPPVDDRELTERDFYDDDDNAVIEGIPRRLYDS